eukprot:2110403-Prymnesium_polylepis.2
MPIDLHGSTPLSSGGWPEAVTGFYEPQNACRRAAPGWTQASDAFPCFGPCVIAIRRTRGVCRSAGFVARAARREPTNQPASGSARVPLAAPRHTDAASTGRLRMGVPPPPGASSA